METAQYDIMSRSEEQHWWYLGLRDAIGCCLEQAAFRLPPNPVVLDAGCGTGANLQYLSSLLKPKYIAGFDLSELALEHARRKCPQADVYQSDIRLPELRRCNYDLILSTDVLYSTGIADTMHGLRALIDSLTPNGLCILNLPAYNWLLSSHDRVVHTCERYTLTSVRKLASDLDLHCELFSYRLFALFPLIVAMRLPSLLLPQRKSQTSELRQPNSWINKMLLSTLRIENRLIARGVRLPFGSSIFVVARKVAP